MSLILFFLIPFTISLGHYIGIKNELRQKKFTPLIQSFAAGVSISYVFLLLLEEVRTFEKELEIEVMLLVLFGFIFFHSSLKFVFRQKSSSESKVLLIDEIHLFALGLYNFVISFSLIDITRNDLRAGIILTALLSVHFILSDLSNDELHNSKLKYKTLIIIAATFFGAFVGIFEILSVSITAMLYAFSAGAIIYMTIREELPDDNESRPLLFVLGALIFALVSFLI